MVAMLAVWLLSGGLFAVRVLSRESDVYLRSFMQVYVTYLSFSRLSVCTTVVSSEQKFCFPCGC